MSRFNKLMVALLLACIVIVGTELILLAIAEVITWLCTFSYLRLASAIISAVLISILTVAFYIQLSKSK